MFNLHHFIRIGMFVSIYLVLSFSAIAVSKPVSLLRLATTTSTANSGLMDYLLPELTKDTGVEVQVIAVGTGKALRLGREGDVDAVLVHARNAEQAFIDGGFGVERFDVMYNDFVLIGPPEDPAQISSSDSVIDVLKKIHDSNNAFVSRGDDSGTHKKELSLWQKTGYMPQGDWYKSVGQGMGKVIQIANEIGAYTMADRGTWLAYQAKLNLALLYQGDPSLFNPYGIIAVNPWRHTHVNQAGTDNLIKWITSEKGQRLIGEFKVKGERLFIPNARQSGQ